MSKRKITADIPQELFDTLRDATSQNGRFPGRTMGWMVARGLEMLLSDNAVEVDPELAERVNQRTSKGVYRDRPLSWMVEEGLLNLLGDSEVPMDDLAVHLNSIQKIMEAIN